MADMAKPLDWGDTVTKDEAFSLLPEGDYNFTITGFERGRYAGGDKLPECNKAVITIKVDDGVNTGTIVHNFFLLDTWENRIGAFFLAIGLKKKGEPVSIAKFSDCIGKTGRCKVIVDEYTNRQGSKNKSNRISTFYEPQPQTGMAGFTPTSDKPPAQWGSWGQSK